jgi:protoheme ferro-lyase
MCPAFVADCIETLRKSVTVAAKRGFLYQRVARTAAGAVPPE